MMYASVTILTTAAIFFFLQESRYRFWAVLSGTLSGLLLSFAVNAVMRAMHLETSIFTAVVTAFIFFVLSLFLQSNKPFQKLLLFGIALCNFSFLSFFIPMLLAAIPVSTAGFAAGILSVCVHLLFTALVILVLYRPFHYFYDRGISGSQIGMLIFLAFLFCLSMGWFDFLFLRSYNLAVRLLSASIGYILLFFFCRSMYHAAKFREQSATLLAKEQLYQLVSKDAAQTLGEIQETQEIQRIGSYSLDTVQVLLADGMEDQLDRYVKNAKENLQSSPLLGSYSDNPYLNAIIAVKAAEAKRMNIHFTFSSAIGKTPIKTEEICVLVRELLTYGMEQTMQYPEEKKMHLSLLGGEERISFELIYSHSEKAEKKFSLKGKSLSQIFQWLFDDQSESDAPLNLVNSEYLISQYGGKITVFHSEDTCRIKGHILY